MERERERGRGEGVKKKNKSSSPKLQPSFLPSSSKNLSEATIHERIPCTFLDLECSLS